MRGFSKIGLLILAIQTVLLLPSRGSAEKPYEVVGVSADTYFGHVSYVEIKDDGQDPVIIREGRMVPEPAALNSPLGPGDTIRTTAVRRCEVQFDTGTIVRLDFDTELKIETVLAQSLTSTSKLTNLVLGRGRVYVMYKEYGRRELFQVLTVNAALKFSHNTVALIKGTEDGVTDVQVKLGKAAVLYGPSAQKVEEKKVKKFERLIVFQNDQSQAAEYVADTEFDLWNDEINAQFLSLHEGQSILPKPVMRYSPGVVAWAQKYSNANGEWIWDDLFGYVWRPHYNDAYPWGTWQPYMYGRWVTAHGQMFWVPDEPWGWIPYHLGIWHWDKKLGWVWIPGSAFASAWASWDFLFGHYAWRPWSLFDWWWYNLYYGDFNMWGFWGFYGSYWGYPYCPDTGTPPGTQPTLRKISKDQLKKPTLPVPRDLKSVLKNLENALKAKDERLLASLQETTRHLVCVPPADIHASRIQDKAVRIDEVTAAAGPLTYRERFINTYRSENPAREAGRDLQRNTGAAARPALAPATARFSSNEPPRANAAPVTRTGSRPVRSSQASARYRDWNPDLKVASRLGVSIRYSSHRNEIQCPELGLTSHNIAVGSPGSAHSGGGFYSSASSASSASSGSSSDGSSSSSSSGSSAHTGGTVRKD